MKRAAIVVVALASIAVVGIVLARSGGGLSDASAAGSVSVVEPNVATSVAVLPSPETAAASAVALTGDVVSAGLISRRELIESFTTPSFGSELADITSGQLTSMRLALTGSGRSDTVLSVAEFPLRSRTIANQGNRATVEVWSVLVVAATGEPVARQAWRTVTLDLDFVDGRWLVDGWSSVDGPTPAGSPDGAIAPGAEVADRLQWSEVP